MPTCRSEVIQNQSFAESGTVFCEGVSAWERASVCERERGRELEGGKDGGREGEKRAIGGDGERLEFFVELALPELSASRLSAQMF